jgi:hypothetical protein
LTETLNNLAARVLTSPGFQSRYRSAQLLAAQHRLRLSERAISPSDLERLILQSSLLALSEHEHHIRISQRLNALLHETLPRNAEQSYALQLITSRIGNHPAVRQESAVFGEFNLAKQLHQFEGSRALSVGLASDLVFEFLNEEHASTLTIGRKQFQFNSHQRRVLAALDYWPIVSFSAPTSFGKSFLVRCHIGRLFTRQSNSRILILVPTKALIDDFLSALASLRTDLGLEFQIRSHARHVPADIGGSIFILTQERLSFLMTKDPGFVSTFDLIYCDEAHSIARGYRGFVLRDVLRKVAGICPIPTRGGRTKFVFTSPIIKNPDYYRHAIFPEATEAESFHEEIQYSPVEKNIHVVTKRERQLHFSLLSDDIDTPGFTQETVPLGSLDDANYESDSIDSDISAVLASNPGGGAILYATSPIEAHRYAYALASRVSPTTAITANELRDLRRYIRDHYDEDFGIAELLEKGIGIHYGPMPLGLRRAIVSLFEAGKLKYVVCTSTLLEGVNLPAKNIFLFSPYHTQEKHTSLTFWNLIGRAGRITYGLSGNVFLVTTAPDAFNELVTNADARITDPETDVGSNTTRRNHIARSLTNPAARFAYTSARERGDIEYVLFELFQTRDPRPILERLGFAPGGINASLLAINEQRGELVIPAHLVGQNPGLDPRLQDGLYRHFQNLPPMQLVELFFLISNSRRISGAKLSPILTTVATFLKWPKYPDTLGKRIAQWLFGMQLSGFVQQGASRLPPGTPGTFNPARVQSAIKVLRMLDKEIAFNTPKYLKCFFDIAVYVFIQRGGRQETATRLQDRVDSFLFAIESGISDHVGKFLFERGVSRAVAIAASRILNVPAGQELNSGFFFRPNIREALVQGLSSIALKELDEHLRA